MESTDDAENEMSKLTFCVVASNRIVDGRREGMGSNTKNITEFVIRRAAWAIAIDHPFITDEDRTPLVSIFQKGSLVRQGRFPLPRFLSLRRNNTSNAIYPLLKLVDLISNLVFVLQGGREIDVYIGTEPVDAISGILLKKIGRVKRVIYHIMEVYPSRYSPLPNSIFLWVDKFCAEHADCVWNESDSIRRKRDQLWKRTFTPQQLVVPTLCAPFEEDCFESRPLHSIVYLGSLDRQWGVQIVITAMQEVLRRIPDAELHVIGTGPFLNLLRLLSTKLGVSSNVFFHGFLPDDGVKKIMKSSRAGVAPYLYEISKRGKLHFDSSKTKNYAHYGVPIVLSDAAPLLADVVLRFNAGLVVASDTRETADAICSLLTDDQLYNQCLRGCRRLAEEYDYERFLKRTLAQSLSFLRT